MVIINAYYTVAGAGGQWPVNDVRDERTKDMPKSKKNAVGRRGFLKRAAAGAAAALAVKPTTASGQAPAEAVRPAAPPASARQVALETAPPPRADVYTTDRPGADFMVDVLKTLNFDYIFSN